MKVRKVGIYVRTTILTNKYNRYETELLSFCEEQGWDDVLIYRDQVGGRIAQSGFDALENSLKQGKIDTDAIGQLVRQQRMDEEHNRDGFRRLLRDALKNKIDLIVVHDAGQLGRNKMEIFRSIEAMFDTGKKVFIPGLGELHSDTPLFGSSQIDCPDNFGIS